MMKKTLVLGAPGTGKTTRLISIMEQALDRGVDPSEIAFCSFTNAAADEARRRAMEKFKLDRKQLPYFRTLHSLAFRELHLAKKDVLGDDHLKELADVTGELVSALDRPVEASQAGAAADPLLTIDHFARTTLMTLREAWEANQTAGGDIDWFRLLRFSEAYRIYREDRELVDYTDMLQRYATSDHALPTRVKVAILDEAQDMTLLQWMVADKAFSQADELWVAADDDQSIHRWAGAAEDHLLGLNDYGKEVLPLSYRLPQDIFDLSQEIIRRVDRRYAKDVRAADHKGTVGWVSSADDVDLSSGQWLMLARTRYQLQALEAEARNQGALYRIKGVSSVNPRHLTAIQAYEGLRAGKQVEGAATVEALRMMGASARKIDEKKFYTRDDFEAKFEKLWHDALVKIPLDDREYYLACARRGERLQDEPRIRIDTFHGAKGQEADNVIMSTDMTKQVHRGYMEEPEQEHRVFYVGATRARQALHLIEPKTMYGYPL